MFQKFPYHLVDQSPWPILASFSLLMTTMGAVMYLHFYEVGAYALSFGLISLVTILLLWFKDVVREATFQGHHTLKVKNGIKMGLILFILSEVLFFAGFFWAFFHSSLVPAISLGSVWPPLGINALNPWEIPLLNSVLLLSSGVRQICNTYFFNNNVYARPFGALAQPLRGSLPFSTPFVLSTKRIGPHNYDLLCLLMGSLLGDASMEKDVNGSRFCFYQESTHKEYLLWLHKTLFDLGYCKHNSPIISQRSGIDGNIRYILRFRTFTYSSFNWIYDSFYISYRMKGNKAISSICGRRKIVPFFIGDFLSPLAIAIWILDDGCKIPNKGIRFSTNSFTLIEVKFLSQIFKDKYNLKTSIHKTGDLNQYNIYITKESTLTLSYLVKPYIHPTMYYKISPGRPD